MTSEPAPRFTLVDTPEELTRAAADLESGTGPLAIDAERASGYRYGQSAYLIQLTRDGSHTWLVDPVACTSLEPLAPVVQSCEWVLHASTQDLPCLREVGLVPRQLFDTELAARLAGLPKVGLAAVIEHYVGITLAKEHSAADWSTRPLPASWLDYAAADVLHLVEVRNHLEDELRQQNKLQWAAQEFAYLLTFQGPPQREQPWRSVSGIHKVRGHRHLGALRELWHTRDAIAREKDLSPGRVLPDAHLVTLALKLPATAPAVTQVGNAKGLARFHRQWLDAIQRGSTSPSPEVAGVSPAVDRPPPPPKAWPDKKPMAAQALALARAHLLHMAEELSVPVENMLTPDTLRRTLWAEPNPDEDDIAQMLRDRHAREWQIELCAPVLIEALRASRS